MTPNEPHDITIKLLFGLFEASATGNVAIGAVLVIFVLMGIGRWRDLW